MDISHTRSQLILSLANGRSNGEQCLRSFCTWSHMSLDRVVNDSQASVLINPQALSSTMLKAKVNDAFQEARDTGPLLMTTILLAIRISTMGNQVMSGLGTDTFMYKSPHRQSVSSIGINTYETVNGSNCTCYSTNTCLTPAAIYSNPVESTFGVYRLNTNSTLVKGMRTACYPLEGVLSSTLEFNYSCRIPQASHLSMRVNRINFLPKPPYKISHKNNGRTVVFRSFSSGLLRSVYPSDVYLLLRASKYSAIHRHDYEYRARWFEYPTPSIGSLAGSTDVKAETKILSYCSQFFLDRS